MNATEISTLVGRLSRPHPSGGVVIERAAILASGADAEAIIDWIMNHHGMPEAAAAPRTRGLHGARVSGSTGPAAGRPTRFVLPAGSLN